MPRVYSRKHSKLPRATWSEEALRQAVSRINSGEICIREAQRIYSIPEATLRRRKKSGDFVKGSLGPKAVLGEENEKRLVEYVKKSAEIGFGLDEKAVRRLAFQFAESLGIKHPFNRLKKEAGYDWMRSFLSRNPDLCVRRAQDLSVARSKGLTWEEINNFYNLYEKTLKEHNLFDKPSNIYNVDESVIQISKVRKVVARRGAMAVSLITAKEKGETLTVIACNNAEGKFLPPVLLMKEVGQNPSFKDGLPPGSEVYMNPKKGFINSELFLKWFKEIFLPRKSVGVNILILDGHATHCNSIELLTIAEENNVIMLCLPSHTTHALQPLVMSFFGPLKKYFANVTQVAVQKNPSTVTCRARIGHLFGEAWEKATSISNCINGYKATGIYPFDRDAISHYMFNIDNVKRPTTPDQSAPSTSMAADLALAQSPLRTPSKLLHEIPQLSEMNRNECRELKQSESVLISPDNIKVEH